MPDAALATPGASSFRQQIWRNLQDLTSEGDRLDRERAEGGGAVPARLGASTSAAPREP